MRTLAVTLVLACGILAAATAFAQAPRPMRDGPGPGSKPRASREVQELVETIMAARLAKELGLNDEQTVVMVRRLAEFRDEMNALKRKRAGLLKTLKAAIRDEEPDETITAKLDELMAHDMKLLKFRKGAYDKVGPELSAAQKARLYVFLADFETEMRQLIQHVRERSGKRQGMFDGPEGPRKQQRALRGGPRRNGQPRQKPETPVTPPPPPDAAE